MKLSQLIDKLTENKRTYGDMEVRVVINDETRSELTATNDVDVRVAMSEVRRPLYCAIDAFIWPDEEEDES